MVQAGSLGRQIRRTYEEEHKRRAHCADAKPVLSANRLRDHFAKYNDWKRVSWITQVAGKGFRRTEARRKNDRSYPSANNRVEKDRCEAR